MSLLLNTLAIQIKYQCLPCVLCLFCVLSIHYQRNSTGLEPHKAEADRLHFQKSVNSYRLTPVLITNGMLTYTTDIASLKDSSLL
jgi:hypothetical protein